MSRRRVRLLVAAAVACTALSIALLGWAVSRPPVTINAASFERVRWGMTEEEVASTFGRPAGTYTRRVAIGPLGPDDGEMRARFWVSDEAFVTVVFGPPAGADDGPAWRLRHKIHNALPRRLSSSASGEWSESDPRRRPPATRRGEVAAAGARVRVDAGAAVVG